MAARFQPAPADLRFGATDGAVWLRLDLARAPGAAADWLLEVVAPQLDYVALYDTAGRARHAGDHLPIADNDVDYRVPVFALSLPAQGQATYYLRLAGVEPITVPLLLWRPVAFFETRLGETMVYGAFYGLVAVMTAYGLCLALMIRDRLYAAFALDIGAVALLIAALSGHVHQLGVSDQPLFADRFTGMAIIVQALAGIIFVSLLLDLRRLLPRVGQILRGLAAAAVVLAVCWWTPLAGWLSGLSWTLAGAAAAVSLGGAAILARRGDRAARIYLVAYAAQTAGAAIHFAQLAGLVSHRGALSHAFMAGATVAVVLFSLAVADRIRRLHAELTARRLAEARLRDLALSDPLTGLANRAQLDQRLTQALERQAGGGHGFAVILVDLDGFKEINDQLGHAAGDDLLRQLAYRLRQTMRAGDCAARFGGDEFVLLAEGVSGPEPASLVAAKIGAALLEPIALEAGPVTLGGSVGIALCPTHGTTAEALLAAADAAMYAAKRSGGAGWAFAVSQAVPDQTVPDQAAPE
jgi:diguanylate cyclase (GGDEF)-like protein